MNIYKIVKNIKVIDWLIFYSFIIITYLIMLMPNRLLFKINIGSDFRIWQLLTSSFVNHNLYNYLGNLLYFILFGLILLIILSNYNSKQKFWFYIIIYFVLPIITSIIIFIICIVYNFSGSFCGNSTIVSGIVYFVLSWFFLISIKLNIKLWTNKKLNYCLLFQTTIILIFGLLYGYFIIFENKFNLGHLIGIVFGIILAIVFSKKYNLNK
jgi:membrane associated rhomboid family serine protease